MLAFSTVEIDACTPREGTFAWVWGDRERVVVFAVRDGRAFVCWPDSGRIDAEGRRLRRPDMWVDVNRITF